jgi:Ca-activated chloride channel family protein
MSFIWPAMLFTLVAVPVLVFAYQRLTARRLSRQAAAGTMSQVRTRTGKPIGYRRHIPAAVFLAGLVLLIVGLARPETTLQLPRHEGTVILAFDTSSSMKARDIKPSRIAAAKQAARTFVGNQPSSIRIGVVSFNDSGTVVQKPTKSRHDVLAAIARLSPGGGTAVGDGIITSIGAIAGKPLHLDAHALQNRTRQSRLPFLGSSVVVLLSDGENTAPLDPVAAADVAAQAGVRVDAVGLGTAAGTVVNIDGFSVATSLDAGLLRRVARTSEGTYFQAAQAASLQRIYSNIDLKLTVHGEKTEITSLFAAAGIFLFMIGGILSIRWFGRVL